MVVHEDTVPRGIARDEGRGATPSEDTIDTRRPAEAETRDALRRPSGTRIDAPPPVRLAAPPQGPPITSHHRIRLGDQETIALAAPVVVGRSPGAPRIATAVIRRSVASPTRQISADHVEITEIGSTVVVRDLRSTNGSTVMVPGRAPRLLAGGDSASVPAGTVIDLGDGVRLEVLPPADPRA